MYKNAAKLSLVIASVLLQSFVAVADRSHEGWDIHVNGYLQLDTVFDSTRTYTEQLNAASVAAQGTANGNGDNGSTKMSARQTRVYLKLNMPDMDGWKTRGWLESDFMGYDPTVTATGAANTEQSFFASPTLRMRNAYVVTENSDGWSFLAGQNWTIFGYQPYFEILNTSTNTPINLIQRTPQIKASKTLAFGDMFKGQADFEIDRPTQKDSTIPNFDLGVRMNFMPERKAGMLKFVGSEFSMESTSVALSGTLREYSTPNLDGNPADKSTYMGGGAALSATVPILISSDGKDMKNNLTFQGEYVIGNGIGDNYVGWNGGLGAFNTGTAGPTGTGVGANQVPNLDAGIGGYDTGGQFQLIQTQEFTAELQYILPTETTMAVNVEYGRLKSNNVANLISSGTQQGTYDYNELMSVDFVYSFSSNIRMIAEYSRMATHYTNNAAGVAQNAYPTNNRYGISTYFMF